MVRFYSDLSGHIDSSTTQMATTSPNMTPARYITRSNNADWQQSHIQNLESDRASLVPHSQYSSALVNTMREAATSESQSEQFINNQPPKRLAFVEIHQETNSFTRLPTTWNEFKNLKFAQGDEVWAFADEYKLQAYGFREAVEKIGKGAFEILPIYCAWAWSGGPIEQSVYNELKTLAIEELSKAGELGGLYVSMHGAMGVDGIRDPESDFLRAMRDLFGPDFPIAVSFDLHANVTSENIELASFLVGYQTNPHRDFRRTGYKAGEVLTKTVLGEVKPVMAWRKMRLLKGGGWGIDLFNPMRGIVRRMKQMERLPDVLVAANFWVHIWNDDKELGWSTVVTTDNNPTLANELAEELAERNWAVRDHKHPEPNSITEAIEIVRSSWLRRMFGTCTFCDVSDIVGAGAPGGNTNILKALYEQAPELRSYVPVRDPEAAIEAFNANPDEGKIRIQIGGRIDPEFNPTVDFEGDIIFQEETRFGKTSIIQHEGLHLLLTELAFTGYFASDYHDLGLNLWKADIVVVKNLFPFRFRLAAYNRRTVNVVTEGITNIDVRALPYKEISRPLYPLDNIEDWRWDSNLNSPTT